MVTGYPRVLGLSATMLGAHFVEMVIVSPLFVY